jgi:hypothetical protein
VHHTVTTVCLHCPKEQAEQQGNHTTSTGKRRDFALHHHLSCHAGLNCLLEYFQVQDSVLPVQQRPSLVLSAEAELGITAGLQDRVIQVNLGSIIVTQAGIEPGLPLGGMFLLKPCVPAGVLLSLKRGWWRSVLQWRGVDSESLS